ncbi:hypothetical protein [Halothiobacillus sp.]|uniref:hypothetical protein n=1 Tax=Halothiobacillus sp. TaxID=1891311 RepID=UPI002AD4296E|nr:hypothetical protein [Halothiobacillus sp.]
MKAGDIASLTPSQIASKYTLPQTPDMITDVTIPSGAKMQVSVANNILKGADSGGGGVQYQIKSIPNNPIQFSKWFSNAGPLE